MQQWEYNYLVFKLEAGRSIKDVIRLDQLNQAGEEGWEMVSVNPLGSNFLMYTFKRPATEAANKVPARNTTNRNEKGTPKARGGNLDIKVAQPKQQPPIQTQPQQGFDLQDILDSILGGNK